MDLEQIYIYRGSSHLSYSHPQTPSPMCPEVCYHDDSKSHQADNIYITQMFGDRGRKVVQSIGKVTQDLHMHDELCCPSQDSCSENVSQYNHWVFRHSNIKSSPARHLHRLKGSCCCQPFKFNMATFKFRQTIYTIAIITSWEYYQIKTSTV